MRASFYARAGKRALDLALASAGLVAASPLLLGAAALILLFDGGPVLFRQERVGRGFKPFVIYKFRTMRAGGGGPALTRGSSDPRVTRLGRLLRETKVDELPQLLNVLRGEMSLVGPRPEVPRFVALFRADYEEILTVKPGITDFAAIRYRDEAAVLDGFADPEQGYVATVLPEKLRLYRDYIRSVRLSTDLKILLATVWKVAAQ
jgi:lipopolysaccharide/colanic/teichoic acid biosynthesis glycosyltransferase